MEVDKPRVKTEDLEVDGFGSDHGSPASQPQNIEPARLRDDTDPWTKGYITDSGRKVVPVKRHATPSVSSSSSRRSTNSTRRSSRVRGDKFWLGQLMNAFLLSALQSRKFWITTV